MSCENKCKFHTNHHVNPFKPKLKRNSKIGSPILYTSAAISASYHVQHNNRRLCLGTVILYISLTSQHINN